MIFSLCAFYINNKHKHEYSGWKISNRNNQQFKKKNESWKSCNKKGLTGNDNKRAPEAADGGLKSAAARGW